MKLDSPVVAVFAHPDDAELTCFGTLALLRDSGAEVTIVVATNGGRSRTADINHDRIREAHEGQGLLSAKLELLGLPDGDVAHDASTVAAVEEVLQRVDPHIVITHYPQERRVGHQDHETIAHIVTNVAMRRHPGASILYAEPPVISTRFEPNLFVDVTDYFAEKLQAIGRHRTESTKFFMDPGVVEERAQWWTLQALHGTGDKSQRFEAFHLAKGVTVTKGRLAGAN
ncbi:PIG-L deacetylase family protein [Nocardia sp. NPDC051052]|uniref:PIG-L deacetylase family protein n=1 Tax=Nocardia sp. NPDC051052 TaxID=3364322 RepID=UPI00378E7AF1